MILVTGGTGLLGAHLLAALSLEKKPLRAIYRNPKKLALVEKVFSYYSQDSKNLFDAIEWVKADVLDIPSLENAFQDVIQVYHAAALVSFDPKEDKKLLNINIDGTTNVVNLSIKYGIKKLGFVSSIAALGPGKPGQVINEENEWTKTASTYGVSKHYAELEIWRASQEGMDVIIVNPGIIIAPGHWKSSSGSFFYQAAKGTNYYLPSGTGFVDVKDVTKAMIQLMDSSIANERFILVNENWSYQKFAQLLAKGLKKPEPKKKITLGMLEVFWRLDWIAGTFLGKRRKLSKATVQFFKTIEEYDHSKLKNALDFQFVDLEKSTLDYCAIFLKEQ